MNLSLKFEPLLQSKNNLILKSIFKHKSAVGQIKFIWSQDKNMIKITLKPQ